MTKEIFIEGFPAELTLKEIDPPDQTLGTDLTGMLTMIMMPGECPEILTTEGLLGIMKEGCTLGILITGVLEILMAEVHQENLMTETFQGIMKAEWDQWTVFR